MSGWVAATAASARRNNAAARTSSRNSGLRRGSDGSAPRSCDVDMPGASRIGVGRAAATPVLVPPGSPFVPLAACPAATDARTLRYWSRMQQAVVAAAFRALGVASLFAPAGHGVAAAWAPAV